MKKSVFSIIVVSILVLAYSAASADTGGPIKLDENSPFVAYESGEYYLIVPELEIGGGEVDYWVKWKLNFNNAGWDLYDYGLTSSATGSRTASGNYIYNSQKGVLIAEIKRSEFLGCGVETGTQVWFLSPITQTSMIWTDPENPEENDQIIWTRSSGISGDIVGTWNSNVRQNSYSVTFYPDRSLTIVGNIVQCD